MTTAIVPNSPSNTISVSMPAIPTMAEVESLKEICKVAAYSGFLSSTAKRDDITARVADAFFVVMYGRELGIPAMTALKTIYVIEGKPSCSGEALLSLMRRARVEVEIPDPVKVRELERAEIRIRRPGGEWRTYTFTKAMAEAASLWGKGTWPKYWPQMMIWRAVSMASKFECSDITGGLYTIEEIAPNTNFDADGTPIGEIVTSTATPTPIKVAEDIPQVSRPATVMGAGIPITLTATEPNPLDWSDDEPTETPLAVIEGVE